MTFIQVNMARCGHLDLHRRCDSCIMRDADLVQKRCLFRCPREDSYKIVQGRSHSVEERIRESAHTSTHQNLLQPLAAGPMRQRRYVLHDYWHRVSPVWHGQRDTAADTSSAYCQ